MADGGSMPDARICDQNMGPYFVWETKKVMIFDEIGDEVNQCLMSTGWHTATMEISAENLAKILKGDN